MKMTDGDVGSTTIIIFRQLTVTLQQCIYVACTSYISTAQERKIPLHDATQQSFLLCFAEAIVDCCG